MHCYFPAIPRIENFMTHCKIFNIGQERKDPHKVLNRTGEVTHEGGGAAQPHIEFN